MRWPWQQTPQPAPPAVDVESLARAVAQQTAAEMLARADNFPSPLSPVGPQQPIYALNHPWQYYTPQSPERKPGGYITTDQMRALAKSYDVLRSCIQHLKREVAAVPGRISPRDAKDKSEKTARAITEAEAFFNADGGLGGVGRRRTHFEAETLEDLLVIGAAAVFFAPTRGGGLYEVVAIDAATIRPRVDAYGWPGPGEVAYEQWIEGVQTGPGYTREQLLYDGLNAVTYSPYFVGPVEWLIQTINAALRADGWNLNWLTNGNTPADILALPESWTPQQVIDFADWWNALLQGNSAQRQKTRFVPGGSQRVGSPSRKDQDFTEYELWLLRRTCGIMGVAPAAIGFAGEQYKVSQEGSLGATTQFGAGQILEFRKHLYDLVLQRLGFAFLQWVDVTDEEEDAKTKAETGEIQIRSGQRTPNEVRAADGLDPLDGGNALFVLNTLVPVEQAAMPPQDGQDPGQTDDGGQAATDQPDNGGFQLLGDQERVLRQWERKALNRLKAGRSALCGFEADALDAGMAEQVCAGLERCDSSQSVRNLFRNVIELLRGSGEFDESKYRRDQGGKFASKGGSDDKSEKASGGAAGGAGTSQKGEATANVDASPETRKAANKFFGREVTDADFQKLLGSPAGAKITIDKRDDGGLIFYSEHSSFEQRHQAQCMRKPDGTPFMLLDLYHLKDSAPEGAGARAFNQMVQHGRELGLDAIVIPEAARTSRGMIGYYVWPRYGADGPIPDDKISELPDNLKGAEKLSDLMKTQEGRDWWKDKGKTVFCYFKLDPESESSKVLAGYLKEKGYD